jgi:uncharacterized membrane protein YbhN (UPF0104 family)
MWKTLQEWLVQLRSADLRFVLGGLAVYWIGAVVVAKRWQVVLRGLGCPVPLWEVMLADAAFIFVNNLTPGRIGGEVLRVAILRSRTKIDWQRAVASSVYDRLVDVTGVVLIALLALPALPLVLDKGRSVLHGLPLARVTPLLLSMVVAGGLVVVLIRLVPPLRDRLRRLVNGLAQWGMPRRNLLESMGWACAVWLLDATRLAVVALAFRCSLRPTQAVAVSLAGGLGGAVPVMGGLGAVESSLMVAMCLFGVTVKTALAVTLVERLISYVQGSLVGGIALFAMGGRSLLQSVRSQSSQEPRA